MGNMSLRTSHCTAEINTHALHTMSLTAHTAPHCTHCVCLRPVSATVSGREDRDREKTVTPTVVLHMTQTRHVARTSDDVACSLC